MYKGRIEKPRVMILLGALLLLISSAATAQVVELNIWKPLPGKNALTLGYGQEARAIHEKLGANVGIGQDTEGRMSYALIFANWTEWAQFGGKLQASEEWSTFLAKISAAPSAELEDQYFLNVVSPLAAETIAVYQFFVWQPQLGRGQELVQGALQAKVIHEKAGASVGVSVDQLGRMHYLMAFESWEAWGKFADTPNPEFQALMTEFNKDPSAELIKVYRGSSL